MDWIESNGILRLELKKRKEHRKLGFTYSKVGLLLLVGLIAFITYLVLHGDSLLSLFIPLSIVFAFGLLFLLVPLFSRDNYTDQEILIDPQNQTVKFLIGEMENQTRLEYSFATFKSIQIDKVQFHEGEDSGKVLWRYRIFLTKYDGSLYWLDSLASKEELIEKINKLKSYINLSILDHSESNLSQKKMGNFETVAEKIPNQTPGKNIRIQKQNDGLVISVNNNYSIEHYLYFVLIFYIVIGIFLGAITHGFWQMLFMAFFGYTFLLVFLGIIGTMILVATRKITVTLTPAVLQTRFEYPLFLSYFNTEEIFRRDQIKKVQVHRLESGAYWLCISHTKDLHIKGKFDFKKFIGGFHSGDFPIFLFQNPEEQIFGLWQFGHKTKNGPSMEDLFYLEGLIQEKVLLYIRENISHD